MPRLLYAIAFLVASIAQPPPRPTAVPAPSQLVLVGRGVTADRRDHVVVWRSADGINWSLPSSVILDGAPARTVSRPHVSFDGVAYHLFWLDPQGHVRNATSRTALTWTSLNPLATFSPTSGATFAEGGGFVLALLVNDSRALVIDLDSARSTLVRDGVRSASLAFGVGKFVMAVVQDNWQVIVLESTDGAQWTTLTPPVIGYTLLDQGRSATIAFAEDRFLLAVGSRLAPAHDVAVVHCDYYEATDGNFGAPRRAAGPCANDYTGLVPARLNGHDLVYLNQEPPVSVSVDFAPWSTAADVLVNGAPSLAVARGMPTAALLVEPRATAPSPTTPTPTTTPSPTHTATYTARPTAPRPTRTATFTPTAALPAATCVPPFTAPVELPAMSASCEVTGDQNTMFDLSFATGADCEDVRALLVTYTAAASICADSAVRIWTTVATGKGTTVGPVVTSSFAGPGQAAPGIRVPLPTGFVGHGTAALAVHVQGVLRVNPEIPCRTECLQRWRADPLALQAVP